MWRSLGLLAVLQLAAVGGVLGSGIETVSAQADPAEGARSLFEEGVAAAEARRWHEAADRFERSYALAGRSSTLFNLAGALAQAGRLVEARARYQLYAESAENADLQAEAQRAIGEIGPRIARLDLTVENLQPVDVVVFDGEPLDRAALGRSVPTDPGPHTVRVVRGEAEVAVHELILSEGQERAITVRAPLASAALGPGTTAIEVPLTEEDEEDEDDGVIASPWLWTLIGLVVAGAVAGVVAFVVVDGGVLPLFNGSADPGMVGLP